MVLQPGTVQYIRYVINKYNAVSHSITYFNVVQYVIMNKLEQNVAIPAPITPHPNKLIKIGHSINYITVAAT